LTRKRNEVVGNIPKNGIHVTGRTSGRTRNLGETNFFAPDFSEITFREYFILSRKRFLLSAGKNETRSHINEEVGLALY